MNLYPPPHPSFVCGSNAVGTPRGADLHLSGASVVAWLLRGLLIAICILAAFG